MFNVEYPRGNGTFSCYLGVNVPTREIAQQWADNFNNKYVGKPYPNGEGVYPFGTAYVIEV